MLPRRDEPLPLHAMRDLLGLVRAMHRAAKANGAGALELARFERVGRDLTAALELGRKSAPGTMDHRAAWERAERATLATADLVTGLDSAEPIVKAAASAVRARR